jgi:DNA-binding CsgD family transcriptional regulator
MLAQHQAILARAEALFGKDRLAEAVAAMKRRRFAGDRSDNRSAIRELSADGIPVAEIACRLNLSRPYVSQVRMELGLAPTRKRILDQRRQEKASQRRELIRQLSADGIRVAEIARRLKLSRPYVSQVRMELGLAPTRKCKP